MKKSNQTKKLRKNVLLGLVGISTLIFIVCFSVPSFSESANEDLLKKIDALQERVDQLEREKKQVNNTKQIGVIAPQQANYWDPFAEMDRMQQQMSRLFQNSFSHRGLSNGGMFSNDMSFADDFDFKENKDGYEISFDLVGMDNEKIDFQINNQSLTVKGEYSREDKNEDSNQYFTSKSFGSFMKTIPLPEDADTTNVKTEKEGDSLVIYLPKKST